MAAAVSGLIGSSDAAEQVHSRRCGVVVHSALARASLPLLALIRSAPCTHERARPRNFSHWPGIREGLSTSSSAGQQVSETELPARWSLVRSGAASREVY